MTVAYEFRRAVEECVRAFKSAAFSPGGTIDAVLSLRVRDALSAYGLYIQVEATSIVTRLFNNTSLNPFIIASDGTVTFGVSPTILVTVAMYTGSGVPTVAATDGSFYFNATGGALTTIYQRRAGAWVGIV